MTRRRPFLFFLKKKRKERVEKARMMQPGKDAWPWIFRKKPKK